MSLCLRHSCCRASTLQHCRTASTVVQQGTVCPRCHCSFTQDTSKDTPIKSHYTLLTICSSQKSKFTFRNVNMIQSIQQCEKDHVVARIYLVPGLHSVSQYPVTNELSCPTFKFRHTKFIDWKIQRTSSCIQ